MTMHHSGICTFSLHPGYLPQGGDLRHALGGLHRAALGWYNLGAKLALDVVKGLQFFHNHKVSSKQMPQRQHTPCHQLS